MDSDSRSNKSPATCNKLGKQIDLRTVAEKDKYQLLEMIERRCLDLCQQLYEKYLTDATIQREIAYAMIVTARQDNNIRTADSQTLRDLYDIQIRNENEFKSTVETMTNTLPNHALDLKFDLVIREYTQDGIEIQPGQPIPRKKVIHQQVPGIPPNTNVQVKRTSPVAIEHAFLTNHPPIPPQNNPTIVRISSKKNSLASAIVSNQPHQPSMVSVTVALPDKSSSRANNRKVIGASKSRDHSRNKRPLPKIKIESNSLMKLAGPVTTKAASRPFKRDSVNSACILDYNFENHSKQNTQNQSHRNSRIINVNTNMQTTLTKSHHPSSTKHKPNSHSRGKSLTEDSLSAIRNININGAVKIKRIIGSKENSKRHSFSSHADIPDGQNQATRIIGDNNHRVSMVNHNADQSSAIDNSIEFKKFDSKKNLNVYSSINKGKPSFESNKNHVYVDLKKSYALAEGSNPQAVIKKQPENKLFSSSFILVKEDNKNEPIATNGSEKTDNIQSTYINAMNKMKHGGIPMAQGKRLSGSLNLGQRLEKLKAKMSMAMKSDQQLNPDTARSHQTQGSQFGNEQYQSFQTGLKNQLDSNDTKRNYSSHNPLSLNMKESFLKNNSGKKGNFSKFNREPSERPQFYTQESGQVIFKKKTPNMRHSYTSNLMARPSDNQFSLLQNKIGTKTISKKGETNSSATNIRLNSIQRSNQQISGPQDMPQRRGSSHSRNVISGKNSYRGYLGGRKPFTSNLKNSNVIQTNSNVGSVQNNAFQMPKHSVYSQQNNRMMRSSEYKISQSSQQNQLFGVTSGRYISSSKATTTPTNNIISSRGRNFAGTVTNSQGRISIKNGSNTIRFS